MTSSRLCIKNLPKYLTESRLKEHFGGKGEVTDVKILRTRDGSSRQMGFVGFRTEQEAETAQKFFDKSFIDTARLVVEFARKVGGGGGEDDARPWSKYSEGSSKHTQLERQQHPEEADAAGKKAKSKKRKQPDEAKAAGDPMLSEFLELMRPRNKARVWANDSATATAAQPAAGVQPAGTAVQPTAKASAKSVAAASRPAAPKGQLQEAGSSDDEDAEYQDLRLVGEEEEPDAAEAAAAGAAAALDDDDENADELYAAKDQVVANAGLSDLDYLKARMTRTLTDDDSSDDGGGGGSSGRSDDEAADGDAVDEDEHMDDATLEQSESADDDAAAGDAEAEAEVAPGSAAWRGDQSGVGPSRQQHQHQQDGRRLGRLAVDDPSSEAAILDGGGRLFLRNLSYSATEDDLREMASQHGEVAEVHLVLDRQTKRSKGIAYVQYAVPEDAVKAYRALDGSTFQGRLLHILPASGPPAGGADRLHSGLAEVQQQEQEQVGDAELTAGGERGPQRQRPDSFKAQREAQRKSDAGNRAAWNSLFMRQDTVAAAVAAHYGVSVRELLDREAPDLPVRMALGEAQVIAQTKQALADAGVDVSRLEASAAAAGRAAGSKSVARSPTALLVKNLPYAATEDALLELLGRPGPVGRLVLPPTRTLAVVEYLEPQAARAAFRSLAYKKFLHVPLYLEWAPAGIFAPDAPTLPQQQQAPVPAAPAARKAKEGGSEPVATVAADADDDGPSTSTIYVKNLAFATTDAGLKKHFDRAISAVGGSLHSARVARRKGPDGKTLLSMGFGFVECDSEDAAKLVIKQLQGSTLDGHKLALQLSQRKPTEARAAKKAAAKAADAAPGGTDAAGSAKLVVRNLAFEATRKDLASLFGSFGAVKSCRLPRKFDGNQRGLGFVEFATKQEARAALEGVAGTHLYGRRLVVEVAKEEEGGLDELRAKTAAKHRADDDGGDAGVGAAPSAKKLRRRAAQ